MAARVFVFGSNLAGVHGAGAAKFAMDKKGARWGYSYGRAGDSFAIPTKDRDIETLPLEEIQDFVTGFLAYARNHPKVIFQVTAIGCGLAGYEHYMVAPLFEGASENCWFQDEWKEYLGDGYQYWSYLK